MFVFGDVVTFDLAVRRARGDHGDLALERNERFEDRGFGAEVFPDLVEIVAFADDRLALAVIAEAAGLDHGGKADARDRRAQRFRRRHVGIVGGADAEPLDKILLDQPVLRGLENLLRRQHRTPRGQHHGGGGRNVLEFIGDDVDIVGEQFQRLDIGIFGAGRVQHHVEGGRIRIRRKHLASQAKPRRRHRQHPAQLSAAENSDGVARLQLHLT